MTTPSLDPVSRKEAVRYLKACLAALEGDTIIPPMPDSLLTLIPRLPSSARRLCLEYNEVGTAVAVIVRSLTQTPK